MSKYLYHYAKQQFDSLLTRDRQGVGDGKRGSDKRYDQHISLFFAPLPMERIAHIHKGKHPFYVSGSIVYEHVVKIEELRGEYYEVVESPEKTELRYDDSISDKEYYRLLDLAIEQNSYNSDSYEALILHHGRFSKIQNKYFEKLPSYSDYKENMTKYAPSVPHLMVYPKSGEIKIYSCSQKTFG